MQLDDETEYFWRKPKVSPRGRFNLLLLEYGEIFYENLSVYQYPVPNSSLKFVESDALRVKGRLHLCSRSIIFEPNDIKKPLLKFIYKSITSEVEHFRLQSEELIQCSVTASGFSTFKCSGYFELKDNDQIGPYKYIDCCPSNNQSDSGKVLCAESRFVFALVHTDINAFFATIRRLRDELNGASRGEGLISLRKQHISQHSNQSLLFDSSQLVDFKEQLLFSEPLHAVRVGPLVLHPGGLMLTEKRFYFQPSHLNNIGDSVQHFDIERIKRIYSRRYLLRQTGIEIFFSHGSSSSIGGGGSLSSVYFVFESTERRDYVVAMIKGLPTFSARGVDNRTGVDRVSSIGSMTRRWQQKDISNFDYLLFLNSEADRSFSDLTQYPIMPHIIADYRSRKLDLTKHETFRDLSKPVGALNPQRLAFFKERYESMTSVATGAEKGMIPFPPPFLYGTHYSTPGYVLYYLVRVAPEHMLCLQNGKFDAADRMFYSVAGMFASCLSNPADLKELIPEFFQGEGEFLSNSECLNLGRRHNGERVDDVELPPWAKNPKDFIKKSRQALESDHVSANLHHWIDLIFGHKQRGVAALEADNLFYHLTYEGSLDLDSDLSPPPNGVTKDGSISRNKMEREAIDVQIQEFGQTPKQLFYEPHPRRDGDASVTPTTFPQKIPQATLINSSNSKRTTLESNGAKHLERRRGEATSSTLEDRPELDGTSACMMKTRGGPPSHDKLRNTGVSTVPKLPKDEPTGHTVSCKKENSSITKQQSISCSNHSSNNKFIDSSTFNPGTPSLLLPAALLDNESDKSPAGGFILLGDDFRAEVTRELLSQQDSISWDPASPSNSLLPGALVVKLKSSSNKESVNKTVSRDRLNTAENKSALSDANDLSEVNIGSTSVQSKNSAPGSHLKVRMQSLWGTISEKTISLIRLDKNQDMDKAKATSAVTSISSSFSSLQVPSSSSLHSTVPIRDNADHSPPIPMLGAISPPSPTVVNKNGKGKVSIPYLREGSHLSSIPTNIALQLCKMHQLPGRQAVTGISAIQIKTDQKGGRIVICASSKDSVMSIFHEDTLCLQSDSQAESGTVGIKGNQSQIEGIKSGVGWWTNITDESSSSYNIEREARSRAVSLNLVSTFVAGSTQISAAAAAAAMFSPLVLIPQIFSSTFTVQSPVCALTSSSCRFSTDASRVLVSSQLGQYCSLYSYSVPDARLLEHNCIRIDSASTIVQRTNPCIAIGRGSQLMISGSHDGIVRLWSLSLRTPVASPSSYGYGVGPLRGHFSPTKEETKQSPIAEFNDAQSPIMCVTLTVLESSSSGNCNSNKILVAAGSMDGTVIVWAVNLAEQSGDVKTVARSLLFCHQLRPSERSVVCVEWILEADREKSNQREMSTEEHDNKRAKNVQQSHTMLLTGAADGCLHCVDCNGRVLAICEVLTDSDDSNISSGVGDQGAKKKQCPLPQLKSLTLTQCSQVPSSTSSTSNLIFCGFSDGSIHIVSLIRASVQIATASASANSQPCTPTIVPLKHDVENCHSEWGGGGGNGIEIGVVQRSGMIMRELIHMRVVIVVPCFSFNPRYSAITAISWLAPVIDRPQSRYAETSSDTTILKDTTIESETGASQAEIVDLVLASPMNQMGILISGDEEGCLRLFRLTFAPPVALAFTSSQGSL